MPFVPFELERWQSTWENRVRWNLSESGVDPMTIRELLALDGRAPDDLLDLTMGYSQGDGTPALQEAIAALYPDATPDEVTVTTGSAEANFVTCWRLVEPGDRVAVMAPTYFQTWGLAQNLGAEVATFPLDPERGWEPDPDAMAAAITPGTKLVVVTNPNNPTGHVLSDAAREQILELVRRAGAWLLCDEVYAGAERDGRTTPSLWGTWERTIAISGLSKAYGLPGLRIGWAVAPPDMKEALWRRHDYTVICPSPTSDWLARLALAHRDDILERTRGILRTNWPILDAWLGRFDDLFTWQAPDCGAICFARVNAPLPTLDLVDRVRREVDILLVPGEHFQMPGYLRFGYGPETDELEEALEVLGRWLDSLTVSGER